MPDPFIGEALEAAGQGDAALPLEMANVQGAFGGDEGGMPAAMPVADRPELLTGVPEQAVAAAHPRFAPFNPMAPGAGRVMGSSELPSPPGVTRAAPTTPGTRPRPANALDLKPAPLPSGKAVGRNFDINDATGRNVGRVELKLTEGGSNVHIEWVSGGRHDDLMNRSWGEPNALGLSAVRDLKNQLKQFFPDAKTVSGFRISGARAKAIDDAYMKKHPDAEGVDAPAGVDMKIPLSEATDEELLAFLRSLG